MDCRETEKLLALYLDGEFSDGEKIEIDEHLSRCDRCSHILEEERSLKEAICAIRLKHAPPDLRESIEVALRTKRRSQALVNTLRFAGALGMLVLAVVSTVLITRSLSQKEGGKECQTCVAQKKPQPPLFHKSPVAPRKSRASSLVSPVALKSERENTRGRFALGGRVKGHQRLRGMRLSPRMVENLVADYLRPRPVEFKGQDSRSAARFYGRRTGLYAQPPQFASWGGKMVGGRVSRFNGGDAVQLLYNIKGKRVTLFMFDPKMMPGITVLKDRASLERMESSAFIMSTPGKRVVALFAHKGIGYSVISDRDEVAMLNLVKHIVRK